MLHAGALKTVKTARDLAVSQPATVRNTTVNGVGAAA